MQVRFLLLQYKCSNMTLRIKATCEQRPFCLFPLTELCSQVGLYLYWTGWIFLDIFQKVLYLKNCLKIQHYDSFTDRERERESYFQGKMMTMLCKINETTSYIIKISKSNFERWICCKKR